ncbi:MAG: 2-C-methyl-D-erythritol 2,4-cyclodiphosphate synthase [Planctomycetota bacterium]
MQPASDDRTQDRPLRIGLGTDLHRLEEGRPLRVGGVEIPSPWGAVGHSDGDAALHALADAILGALAEGDIGELFPDTDRENAGLDSRRIVEAAVARAGARGYGVANADLVVELESPRLLAQRAAIREQIGGLLGITIDRVGFQAKTGEGIGEIGEGRAIRAQAVVLLERVRPES